MEVSPSLIENQPSSPRGTTSGVSTVTKLGSLPYFGKEHEFQKAERYDSALQCALRLRDTAEELRYDFFQGVRRHPLMAKLAALGTAAAVVEGMNLEGCRTAMASDVVNLPSVNVEEDDSCLSWMPMEFSPHGIAVTPCTSTSFNPEDCSLRDLDEMIKQLEREFRDAADRRDNDPLSEKMYDEVQGDVDRLYAELNKLRAIRKKRVAQNAEETASAARFWGAFILYAAGVATLLGLPALLKKIFGEGVRRRRWTGS